MDRFRLCRDRSWLGVRVGDEARPLQRQLKVASIVALLALILTGLASAQTTGDSRLQDLKRATQALAAARAAGDGEAWGRLSAPEFVVIHPDGRIHNRAEEVAELKATPPAGELVREDEQLHWYGDDTVVLTLRFVARGGQPVRAIEVWVRQDSSWKIAAAQVTRISTQP